MDITEVAGCLNRLELGHIALGFQRVLQRRNPVEVVLQCALVASRDHQDVVQSNVDSLFNNVLNGRLVHHWKHFLGHGFGGWQESGAEPGCGDYGLAYSLLRGSHWTNLTEGLTIQ